MCCEGSGKEPSGATFSYRHFMKIGSGGGRNRTARKEVLEEAGLPKSKQCQVCGEIDAPDGYSLESL